MKIKICIFFEIMSKKLKFHENLTRITGNLHEDQYIFLIIYCLIHHRIKNVSDKIFRENQNKHFIFYIFFS